MKRTLTLLALTVGLSTMNSLAQSEGDEARRSDGSPARRDRERPRQLTEPCLDSDLPDRRGADQNFIGFGLNDMTRTAHQTLVSIEPPQEHVGV